MLLEKPRSSLIQTKQSLGEKNDKIVFELLLSPTLLPVFNNVDVRWSPSIEWGNAGWC